MEENLLEQQRMNRMNKHLNKQHSFKEVQSILIQYFKSVDQYRDNVSSDYLKHYNEVRRKEEVKHQLERDFLERQKKMA